MSSPILTPDALRSELRPWRGTGWRLVEAQHHVSTLKLVDSLDEQALLETILEDSKPPLPEPCRDLDYLLATPFRYRPYPQGSRFRRAGLSPGVWYGAEDVATAVAEMAFYRLLFFAESPGTPWPDEAADYTAFSARLATPARLDLTAPALVQLAGRDQAESWRHPTDYAACQDMADAARLAGAGIIRYRSVRDPAGGANLAVLDCGVFAAKTPQSRQTWRIRVSAYGVQALCDHPRRGLEFPAAGFDRDPRLARLDRRG